MGTEDFLFYWFCFWWCFKHLVGCCRRFWLRRKSRKRRKKIEFRTLHVVLRFFNFRKRKKCFAAFAAVWRILLNAVHGFGCRENLGNEEKMKFRTLHFVLYIYIISENKESFFGCFGGSSKDLILCCRWPSSMEIVVLGLVKWKV